MSPEIYTMELTVGRDAIDSLGHVNNVIYLKWAQEISIRHWESIAPKEIQKKVYWVILSHSITYKNPAFEGEALIIKTWVDNHHGSKSTRCVEVYREIDDKLIAKARTQWCLIDAKSHRPIRIAPEITDAFSPTH